MRRTATAWLGTGAALALLLTGCSSTQSGSGNEGGGGGGDLQTDFGVTDSEISLGVLTDQTGVFKAVGLNLTQGNQLWADHVNADGGICEREIKLSISDHGYKPDNSVPLYDQQKETVAGYLQLLGSPVVAALKGKIVNDQIMAAIATQSTINLDNDYLMMVGTGYDLEMINGLAWAQEQGMLKDGDTIAHIYVDSEYGQNGLLGAKYYAEQHDLTINEVAVSAADTDMTATMTKIKQGNPTLIALSLAPAGAASVALQNQAQGLNVPLIGNNPVFATTMLADPGVVSALENMHVLSGGEPFAGDSEQNKKIQEEFATTFAGEAPGYGVPAGYLEGLLWGAILEKACENGDMTRQGLLDARLSLDDVDAMGLSDNMDLTDPGVPPVRSSYVFGVDANAPGGEVVEAGPILSDEAKEYRTPHQK